MGGMILYKYKLAIANRIKRKGGNFMNDVVNILLSYIPASVLAVVIFIIISSIKRLMLRLSRQNSSY